MKFLSRLKAATVAVALAMFFTLGLMPTPMHAKLTWLSQPQGYVAKNDGTSATYKSSVIQTMGYPWQWSGPFTLTMLTGTAGATVILPVGIDTNVLSSYQGPLDVKFISTSGTVYYAFQNLSYAGSVYPLTTTAANLTGIPVLVNTLGDTGDIWPGQYVSFQQLATVTQTATTLVYWVLDRNW